jgi:hypothetical protein
MLASSGLSWLQVLMPGWDRGGTDFPPGPCWGWGAKTTRSRSGSYHWGGELAFQEDVTGEGRHDGYGGHNGGQG